MTRGAKSWSTRCKTPCMESRGTTTITAGTVRGHASVPTIGVTAGIGPEAENVNTANIVTIVIIIGTESITTGKNLIRG